MTPQFEVGGRVSHPLPGCRIKVIRQATDAFSVARFRVERQILATLSHPNIARIYDGGTTE